MSEFHTKSAAIKSFATVGILEKDELILSCIDSPDMIEDKLHRVEIS
jgi:hypothetical protein